jgi:hypothetical protein
MWRNLRYHPGILGKGTADERSKFLGQESQSPGLDLNSETPEYDACVVCLVNELKRVRNFVRIYRDKAKRYAGQGCIFQLTWVAFLAFPAVLTLWRVAT